ncbi:sialidase family protein [Arcanobacterium haemolyticum]|uniref:exo-alpha-sialidase n=1 Tax=Arcanobacterium haemolyticum (strain ATCC 9345 / DSM 20595 / CCM 5947 / CCUG 17215 / LMG 16163 / NBRC 15585 / NCTC 8452 / 11018) TaxID=644284 RepID=D7BLJ5_ARCHD|nr:sialidase family protein [Arcanobacterium haemolyticum]ADH91794.1 Exo-alpha-sialidase [Arcanobacterium haemolyticum DSM 20595]SQH27393.1 Sialidase precursor [Arcanobacterium haemolyticum]
MKYQHIRKAVLAGIASSTLVFSGLAMAPLGHAADAEAPHPEAATAAPASEETLGTAEAVNLPAKEGLKPQPSAQIGLGFSDITEPIAIQENVEGINYRIPAITATPKGDLIAAFDERPLSSEKASWTQLFGRRHWKNGGDSPNPNSIVQYRSVDNGKSWQKENNICDGTVTSDMEKISGCSDPSYVVDWDTGKIFNFHVRSYRAGLHESKSGNDAASHDVVQVEISESIDDGKTWNSRIITKNVTPDGNVKWRFATSGQGIQLTHRSHKGWLIQQFTLGQGEPGTKQEAFSFISKDGGTTWNAGDAVGADMDENKVVELSDGRLLLTSRHKNGKRLGKRIQAFSKNGGFSWERESVMPDVVDHGTNGQILKVFPGIPSEDPRSKVLLFANSTSNIGDNDRHNGTVWLSCNDGENWTSKEFNKGSTGYVTITTQHDGRIGMLSEDGKNGKKEHGIYYRSFGLDWVGTCPGVKEAIELDKAKADLEKAKSEKAKLEKQVAKQAEGLEKLQQNLEKAENKAVALQENVDKLALDIKAKTEALDELKADSETTRAEKARLQKEFDSINAKLEVAKAEKQRVASDLAVKEAKLTESEKQKAAAEKKVAEQHKQIEDLNAKVKKAESERDQATESAKNLEEKAKEDAKSIEGLEGNLSEFADENDALRSKINKLTKENTDLKAQLEKVKKELEEAKKVPQDDVKPKPAPQPAPQPEPAPEVKGVTPHVDGITPDASDPAACMVTPYVKVSPVEGVTYEVTVDGQVISPTKDDLFTYEYLYGKTVKVNAILKDGFTLAKGAKTTWSWTAPNRDELKCDTPARPVDPTPVPPGEDPSPQVKDVPQDKVDTKITADTKAESKGLAKTGLSLGIITVLAALCIIGGTTATRRRHD